MVFYFADYFKLCLDIKNPVQESTGFFFLIKCKTIINYKNST